MKISTASGIVICLSVAYISKLAAQEWTRLRGPNGGGISHAKTIPTKWSEKDFNWKIELSDLATLLLSCEAQTLRHVR